MTLSFIPEDLPAPFLTYLKASLESLLQGDPRTRTRSTSGEGKTEQGRELEERRLHPVSVIVNSHNYYYLERWARGGQGRGWGGWNGVLCTCRLARLILLPVTLTAARLITQASRSL